MTCIVSDLVTAGAVNQAVGLVRILDRERSAGPAAGQEQRARLAIVEPHIGERVAVGIRGSGGAEVDALAGLHGELVGVLELCDGRMVRLRIRLDGPVHARGEIVLVGRAPAPDRRLVAGVPNPVHAEDLVVGVAPERPRLGFIEPLCASAACRAHSGRPSCPSRDVLDRPARSGRDTESSGVSPSIRNVVRGCWAPSGPLPRMF